MLSALVRGYAVCDQWFASVPTDTLPNRAFACSATSQGHMDDKTHTFTAPSIFGLLGQHNIPWAIYGYDTQPLTKDTFTDITGADPSHFGVFTDFTAAAANGTLPAFTFLEPSWSSTGNSQHPNYDVALGEQLMHDVYEALRGAQGWAQTLLVITYDEHGGCYDHVPPPSGATPPDDDAGEFSFDFTRFGVRVPAVLVSPLIAPGTVYRVPAGSTPLDHTSVLKTVQQRWGPPPSPRTCRRSRPNWSPASSRQESPRRPAARPQRASKDYTTTSARTAERPNGRGCRPPSGWRVRRRSARPRPAAAAGTASPASASAPGTRARWR